MYHSINPYDLGDSQLVEHTQSVSVNSLLRQARKQLKLRLVEAQIEALGITISLTTSRTRFNGERIWFVCPLCEKRVGILYQSPVLIGCRKCLYLKYKKQRYKGMLEDS